MIDNGPSLLPHWGDSIIRVVRDHFLVATDIDRVKYVQYFFQKNAHWILQWTRAWILILGNFGMASHPASTLTPISIASVNLELEMR